MPGVRCVQRAVPIRRVGLYVPGGKAPFFSTVLMLARAGPRGGCRGGALHPGAPRRRDRPGDSLRRNGMRREPRIFALGGAQAVAQWPTARRAFRRWTRSSGPGNRYVTKAKQLDRRDVVAVDLPAGPSEVLVLADDEGIAGVCRRGPALAGRARRGQPVDGLRLGGFCAGCGRAVEEQLQRLERAEIIREALRTSRIIVLADRDERIAFSKAYAPEHLIVAMRDAWEAAVQVPTAGSVFVGPGLPRVPETTPRGRTTPFRRAGGHAPTAG